MHDEIKKKKKEREMRAVRDARRKERGVGLGSSAISF